MPPAPPPAAHPQPSTSNATQPADTELDDYDGFVRDALVEERKSRLDQAISEIHRDVESSSDDEDNEEDAGAGAPHPPHYLHILLIYHHILR